MRAFRQRVQNHLAAGWELEHDHGDRVVLVDRDIGSIGIHVVLLLATGGLGNLLYGWYHYSSEATRRQLSIDDAASYSVEPTHTEVGSGVSSDLVSTAFGVVVVLIAAYLFAVGVVISSIVLSVIGLFCALVGFRLIPSVNRLLARRHDLATFGRIKTVDSRLIRASEDCTESCIVCQNPIDEGLLRRRRDETVIAGIPIRTHVHSHNYYCARCARAEFAQADAATVSTERIERATE